LGASRNSTLPSGDKLKSSFKGIPDENCTSTVSATFVNASTAFKCSIAYDDFEGSSTLSEINAPDSLEILVSVTDSPPKPLIINSFSFSAWNSTASPIVSASLIAFFHGSEIRDA